MTQPVTLLQYNDEKSQSLFFRKTHYRIVFFGGDINNHSNVHRLNSYTVSCKAKADKPGYNELDFKIADEDIHSPSAI